MRTSRILVLLFVLPIMALSCRSPQERSRGSIIGNGMIRFQNPIYQYSFEYDSRLTLIEQSQELVALEDRNLAGPRGLGVSKGVFEIVKVPTMESNDLLSYAEAKFPEHAWKPIDGYGVPGVAQISRSSIQSFDYLFFLEKRSVLQVHITLGSSDQGAELIKKVMDSLTIDKESPVIREMYFDPPTVRAGSTAKLKVHATDNFGVVFDRTSEQSAGFERYRQCRNFLNTDSARKIKIPSCGALRFLGNDWYEMEIPIPARLRRGSFTLESLTIGDEAGNIASVSFPGFYCKSGTGFPCDGSMTPKPIRFAPLEVENDDPDVQAPILRNVRFEPATIVAGEASKLIFDASDDDPGFSVKAQISLFALRKGDVRTDSLSTEREQSIYVNQPFAFDPPRHRDDGSWEITFRSEAYMRPGNYDISFTVGDRAYNEASSHSPLIVRNDGIIDSESPRLFEIKASKNQYKRGEPATMLIRASDNLSRIEILTWGGEAGCSSKVGLSLFVGSNFSRTVAVCAKDFRHVNGDWYAFELMLGENVPAGLYQIQSFILRDGVGNIGYFNLGKEGNYLDQIQLATEAKRLSFQVVR